MPTLKTIINQMGDNDDYILEINQFLQQKEQEKRIMLGLKNNIPFDSIFNEYKLTAKPDCFMGVSPEGYRFTITKNDSKFITGIILYIVKEQKFKIEFNYDYERNLKQLDQNIVQLFKTAI